MPCLKNHFIPHPKDWRTDSRYRINVEDVFYGALTECALPAPHAAMDA